MGRKGFWIASIGIIFGFVVGFFFANMLNRQEIDALKAKAAQAQAQTPPQDAAKMELGEDNSPEQEQELSPDEIRQKIERADQNPQNIPYQKDLGLALYQYAGIKRDTTWLADAKRLMLRAYEKDQKDTKLVLALANVCFDIGQSKQDNAVLQEARKYYTQALQLQPKQVDVQTDIGSTYYLETPPQYEKAVAEYRKALALDPDHTRTLDDISRTMIMLGRFDEAESFLAKLKNTDANYPGIPDLDALLQEKKAAK
jgi:tetratricopeptide (TPR) repeat protein